jgi:hypothetical protein
VKLDGNALKQITDVLTQQGYLKKGKRFRDAFNQFISNENFEERADSEAAWIDGPVLKYLVKRFEGGTASRSSAKQSAHDGGLPPDRPE